MGVFILPTMLGLIILNIYPIFKTIYESFFKTGDFGKGNIFIGFDNYVKLFHDAEVWQALLNTFKYAIVEVPFSIAIALVLAVLLNRKMNVPCCLQDYFLPAYGCCSGCDRHGMEMAVQLRVRSSQSHFSHKDQLDL